MSSLEENSFLRDIVRQAMGHTPNRGLVPFAKLCQMEMPHTYHQPRYQVFSLPPSRVPTSPTALIPQLLLLASRTPAPLSLAAVLPCLELHAGGAAWTWTQPSAYSSFPELLHGHHCFRASPVPPVHALLFFPFNCQV